MKFGWDLSGQHERRVLGKTRFLSCELLAYIRWRRISLLTESLHMYTYIYIYYIFSTLCMWVWVYNQIIRDCLLRLSHSSSDLLSPVVQFSPPSTVKIATGNGQALTSLVQYHFWDLQILEGITRKKTSTQSSWLVNLPPLHNHWFPLITIKALLNPECS